MLQNKKILIGITGGIAAYKIPILVRLFVKNGANIKVVMTPFAREFVSPKTLSVLSNNEVLVDFFTTANTWNNHVDLAAWADLFIIAPATANTLSKMANGLCDNLLMAVYLSAKCQVYVAPAMDLDMYKHATTKTNLDTLKAAGVNIIPAENGELASGLHGEGRMAEPETIFNFIHQHFYKTLPLFGKKVLVNAGPTYEAIDPVRFIGNRSSGKTGVAIADYFASMGADVHLVHGPITIQPTNGNVKCIAVESADEMLEACEKIFPNTYITVCAAAVADFKPVKVSKEKIKKEKQEPVIELQKNPDILARLGSLKKQKQFLIGFALETENLELLAYKKLKDKNADLIIANWAVNEKGSVFGSDSNEVKIIDRNNNLVNFELTNKQLLAEQIVKQILQFISINTN